VVAPACIPTRKGSFFPTSPLTPGGGGGGVFNDGYSNRGEVESYCDFDLHFLLARDGEHFFMCFLAI
jgi:hypothetical protein